MLKGHAFGLNKLATIQNTKTYILSPWDINSDKVGYSSSFQICKH